MDQWKLFFLGLVYWFCWNWKSPKVCFLYEYQPSHHKYHKYPKDGDDNWGECDDSDIEVVVQKKHLGTLKDPKDGAEPDHRVIDCQKNNAVDVVSRFVMLCHFKPCDSSCTILLHGIILFMYIRSYSVISCCIMFGYSTLFGCFEYGKSFQLACFLLLI